jgi:molybdopterin converting factor small subunit
VSAIIQVPARLQAITGQAEIHVEGSSIASVLQQFVVRFPELEPLLFDGEDLRPYVRVYLNEEEITYLQGSSTAVEDGDCITVIPTVGESP